MPMAACNAIIDRCVVVLSVNRIALLVESGSPKLV